MVISLPFTVGTVELENLGQKSCNTDVHLVLTIYIVPDAVYHCTFMLYYHKVIENYFFTENKRKIKLIPRCHIHTHSNTDSSLSPPCFAVSKTSYLCTLMLLLSCLRQMFTAKVN